MHGSEVPTWQNVNVLKSLPACKKAENADRECLREVGRLFARTEYLPIRLLGRGGMGEVYAAEHKATKERLAIKLLRKEFAGRVDLVERMRIEANALQVVRHPNVVRGRASARSIGGRPFVVMERLVGHTLEDELRIRGALPFVEAIEVTSELLAALEAVHAAGVIHRDIKPENLMLCRNGGRWVVKLIDFGVARITDEGRREHAHLGPPTAAGTRLGTPGYCAPEQSRGDPIDTRADLYSVGVVLYRFLAGRRPPTEPAEPAARARAMRSLRGVATSPPSVHARQPIPPHLDHVVLKALSECPQDRYSDAAAFRRELASVVAVDSSTTTLPRTARSLYMPWTSPRPAMNSVRLASSCAVGPWGWRSGSDTTRARPAPTRRCRCHECPCSRPRLPPNSTDPIRLIEVVLSAAVFAVVVSIFALWWAR